MEPTTFQKKVYKVTATVPKGKVTTYGAIAHALGTKAYRAVGTALNKNPFAPQVPCHRVINTNGQLGGFASGLRNKKKMLRAEGVTILSNDTIDLKKHGFPLRKLRG